MARPPRDPRLRLDQPGQRPLLQGHLRRGGRPTGDEPGDSPSPIPEPPVDEPSAQPADEAATGQASATRGKATRSPAKVSTRRNLEGSEQGPA